MKQNFAHDTAKTMRTMLVMSARKSCASQAFAALQPSRVCQELESEAFFLDTRARGSNAPRLAVPSNNMFRPTIPFNLDLATPNKVNRVVRNTAPPGDFVVTICNTAQTACGREQQERILNNVFKF